MQTIKIVLITALMASGLVAVDSTGGAAQQSISITVLVPILPEDGGPRNWEVLTRLNLREQPSTQARILTQYAPGTILDNLGCQLSCRKQP